MRRGGGERMIVESIRIDKQRKEREKKADWPSINQKETTRIDDTGHVSRSGGTCLVAMRSSVPSVEELTWRRSHRRGRLLWVSILILKNGIWRPERLRGDSHLRTTGVLGDILKIGFAKSKKKTCNWLFCRIFDRWWERDDFEGPQGAFYIFDDTGPARVGIRCWY